MFTRGRDKDILNTNYPTESGCMFHFHVGADGFVDYEMNCKGNQKRWTIDNGDEEFNTVYERIVQYDFSNGKAHPVVEPEYAGMVTFHYSQEYFQ